MVVAWGMNDVGQCNVPAHLGDVIAVAGGYEHSLALRANGTVLGWGKTNFAPAMVPANLAGVKAIAAGWYHSVALGSNGVVTVWGTNDVVGYDILAVPASATNITAIAAGAGHTLALRNNGTVVAWGFNEDGETDVPLNLTDVVSIAAGVNHSMALKKDGTVVVWGSTSNGQANMPTNVSDVVAIAAGNNNCMVQNVDGTIIAWGDNYCGVTNVPASMTDVLEMAIGDGFALAIESDHTLSAWGNNSYGQIAPTTNFDHTIDIAAGYEHGLAVRTGLLTPLIIQHPSSRTELPNSSVVFTAKGIGLAGVTYQWQWNGTNISGATKSSFSISNIQTNNEGAYAVVISTGAGSVTSNPAMLSVVKAPVVTAITPVNLGVNWFDSQNWQTLSVNATALAQDRYPIQYQWKKDGVPISGAASSAFNVGIANRTRAQIEGQYSVSISNIVGGTNVGNWTIKAAPAGGVGACGANHYGQCDWPLNLTNIIGLAAGWYHSLALKEDGSVIQFGSNWANIPVSLTNVVAVAAGYEHSLALKADGTVTAWGTPNIRQIQVPGSLSGVKAISAGWYHSVAMGSNGTITVWGTNAIDGCDLLTVPTSATNIISISAGAAHTLALRSNGTVVAWGYNDSQQASVPANATNIVAIAGGGMHSLALRKDGTVMAWGENGYGQCSVPSGLSNVMAIAAGMEHSVALQNNGNVVWWGNNYYGQLGNGSGLTQTKLIAAGGDHTLLSTYSMPVSYQVDVEKDLLLVYNSSSQDSSNVCAYYRAHRPFANRAGVVGINCYANEFSTGGWFKTNILQPLLNWQASNPTVHPSYIILFLDIPSRLYDTEGYPYSGSVSYALRQSLPGIPAFITHINMNGTNDCKAYIDKLEFFGTNYSPGRLIISASQGNYPNTNYVLDGIRHGGPSGSGLDNYSDEGARVASGTNGLMNAGVSTNAILFFDGLECMTNGVLYPLPHPTNYSCLAGYVSWGAHSSLGSDYAVNTNKLCWGPNSRWWIINTIESFNGQRNNNSQGTFIKWFSSNAFGGTNYLNTPVGAITHTEEPFDKINDTAEYFSAWAFKKPFGYCAWSAQKTTKFQAIGDPLINK